MLNMVRIIIDSCSVILLSKASVLEKVSEQHDASVTEEVFHEVMAGKEKKFLDALLLERLFKEKKIGKSHIKNKKLMGKLEEDFGLGEGEASTLALAIETNQIIMTDNKQGRKTAKTYGLKLSGSPEAIVSLFKAKKISENKAIEALKILREFGWFNDYIIEKSMKEIKND